MLPQLIHHQYTRSTRDVTTNLPQNLTSLYTHLTPTARKNPSLIPSIQFPQISLRTSARVSPARYEKRLSKEIQINLLQKERIFKAKTAERLWEDFGIYVKKTDIKDSSIEEIMEKAYYVFLYGKMNDAATKIQLSWRDYCVYKEKIRITVLREIAARKLQKAWKKYKILVLNPKKTYSYKEKAAICIQKHYRGYRSRIHFSVLKGRAILKANLRYFDSIRDEVYKESVKIIWRVWKKYKAKKLKRTQSPSKQIKSPTKNGFFKTVQQARPSFRRPK
ncbi:hypothetical protein SteCoe_2948 [Stentor coeruleus]|uniref:Sfi1 spindle body domain-containing protein n=1 Tax=Stentor coeruleus TaxID=5963 RepID=A0A1R2CYE8_9CILI|nr:hypothetical protein SteCoe_2948 [Stentor coeruleus]